MRSTTKDTYLILYLYIISIRFFLIHNNTQELLIDQRSEITPGKAQGTIFYAEVQCEVIHMQEKHSTAVLGLWPQENLLMEV